MIEPWSGASVKTEIEHAKWLVWHGKGVKSVARIKALDALLMANTSYENSTLWWNLRRLYFYIENNAATLVNYGARYHKGLPISSSIAESAVKQIVSHRMAKKQQMCWTDDGAHCLAQVRVAVLNDEFSLKRLAELATFHALTRLKRARPRDFALPRFGSLSYRAASCNHCLKLGQSLFDNLGRA